MVQIKACALSRIDTKVTVTFTYIVALPHVAMDLPKVCNFTLHMPIETNSSLL